MQSINHHWHLLTCPSKLCKEAWITFYNKLDQICDEHNLDPGLRRVLTNILLPFGPSRELLELSESYQVLYDSQLRLGHRSLFLGLFLKTWSTTQLDYLQRNFLPHQHQQAPHVIKLITKLLLEQVHTIWHIRNNELHKHDPTKSPAHQHSILQQTVRDYYDKVPLLQHIDRQLFDMPLLQRLQHSTAQLQEFVDYVKPLVSHSIKAAEAQIKRTNKPIQDFLHNTSSATTSSASTITPTPDPLDPTKN